MKLSEMFAEQDAQSFEERRAEVIEIVRSATDFAGADVGLQSIFRAMCAADDEKSFNETFEELMVSISETTTRALQEASSS
jgi:hypothetical protein